MKKLQLDPSLTEAQLQRAEHRLARWKEVVAFYTLRLSLAPLVETAILLDRVLYLYEHGKDIGLIKHNLLMISYTRKRLCHNFLVESSGYCWPHLGLKGSRNVYQAQVND